jgi:hypothetical protein
MCFNLHCYISSASFDEKNILNGSTNITSILTSMCGMVETEIRQRVGQFDAC